MDHHAPNLKVVARLDAEHGIVLVGGAQFDVAFCLVRKVEVFHRELAVPVSHYDRAVAGLDGAVDNHAVAIEDAGVFHRVAVDVAIERGFGVLDIIFVEIQPLVLIIVGGRWEARSDRRVLQREICRERALYDFDISHEVQMCQGFYANKKKYNGNIGRKRQLRTGQLLRSIMTATGTTRPIIYACSAERQLKFMKVVQVVDKKTRFANQLSKTAVMNK